ncbi:hypothetical protein ACOYW6_08350 [Parablastomonas sp. CN1-191]|uniref:hypothetical protein n=1 Tax=Parablastomonas sp. CN1-191 TaxID=3400908 RepID=UPI003BF7FF22
MKEFSRVIALVGMLAAPLHADGPAPEPALSPAAQDQVCQTSVGQRVSPIQIDQLISGLGANTQPRGEFETTAQYEARLKAAGAAAPASAFVSLPIDTKYITYDADVGRFKIESYALDNKNASWDAFYDGPNPPWPRPMGSPGFVDFVVRSVETITGSYPAANAYGAKVTVNKVRRETVGVLERTAVGSEDLFRADRPWVSHESNVVAEVAVDPMLAPSWRENIRAAAVIVPKQPYVARATKQWGPARIDLPKEITEDLTAVIADIRCIVLIDQAGRVQARVPTR